MSKEKQIALKPCPFCGGEAEVIHTRVYLDEARRVGCTLCHVVTPAVLVNHPAYTENSFGKPDESTRYTAERAEEKAAEVWNRRVDQ